MIVRLNGGLGNQMFQYAFGRSVSAARKESLFFIKHELDGGRHRAYSLGAFKTELNFSAPSFVSSIYKEKTFAFDPDVYNAPPNALYIGCWQTERYFHAGVVRKDFELRKMTSEATQHMAKRIQSVHSTFIHVRRTDYLVPSTAAYHGNMSMDYYRQAIAIASYHRPATQFFIFSDDIPWCRTQFPPHCIFVDHNTMGNGAAGPGTEHEDLYLMSLCNGAIIPNSSFGWWGAWLGNLDKRVIAPKRWFSGASHLDTKDLLPERWMKL